MEAQIEKLLTLDKVAEVLDTTARAVRVYVRSGRLPAMRLGREYRVTPENLRHFIADNTAATGLSLTAGHEPAVSVREPEAKAARGKK